MTTQARQLTERRGGGDRRASVTSQRAGTTGSVPHRTKRAPVPDPDCAPETALELLVAATSADVQVLRAVAQRLSHELRTPLTTIYSGSKLLSRQSFRLSEPLVREVSAAIEADSERLLRVVEDLVVAAALPGEPAIHGEPVLLQHLVPSLAQGTQMRWPAVTLDVTLPTQLPAARADDVYLDQVLRNLLDNAARYGPADGRIAVRAFSAGDRVEIHVLDDGPGIDPGRAKDVFRLFSGPGTSSRQGGLGLGLFVSRRLVEQMGGRMWLAARAGGGSDFAFDLAAYPVDPH